MASLLVATHQEIVGGSLPSGEGFPDAVGNAHEANIRKLVAAGITVGFPDGTYPPDASMTRGQMATFQARYAQLLVAEQLASVPA